MGDVGEGAMTPVGRPPVYPRYTEIPVTPEEDEAFTEMEAEDRVRNMHRNIPPEYSQAPQEDGC